MWPLLLDKAFLPSISLDLQVKNKRSGIHSHMWSVLKLRCWSGWGQNLLSPISFDLAIKKQDDRLSSSSNLVHDRLVATILLCFSSLQHQEFRLMVEGWDERPMGGRFWFSLTYPPFQMDSTLLLSVSEFPNSAIDKTGLKKPAWFKWLNHSGQRFN